jgi:hypothetical protein
MSKLAAHYIILLTLAVLAQNVMLAVPDHVVRAHSLQQHHHSQIMKTVPYCNISNVLIGEWKYRDIQDASLRYVSNVTTLQDMITESYGRCPRTLLRVSNAEKLRYQPQDYSCDPRYTAPAYWVPSDCQIMSPRVAIARLTHWRRQLDEYGIVDSVAKTSHEKNAHAINIHFLGDSIGGQFFVAMDCIVNSVNMSHVINVTYGVEALFRYDIPCDANCTLPGTIGARFRKSQAGEVVLLYFFIFLYIL